jgi:hypothetical protein
MLDQNPTILFLSSASDARRSRAAFILIFDGCSSRHVPLLLVSLRSCSILIGRLLPRTTR